jgi:hypothetical protein
MPEKIKGSIDLSSLNPDTISNLFTLQNFNITKVRSVKYKELINKEFIKTFPLFCSFFAKKYNLENSQRLKNYLNPWWVQAVLFKLDRESIAKEIVASDITSYTCYSDVSLEPFSDHTDIKNKIGSCLKLNYFYLALLLKDYNLDFIKIKGNNYSDKQSQEALTQKGNKETLKNFLQVFLNYYVIKISSLFGKSFILITDTSNFSKFNLLLNILMCKHLPVFELIEDKKNMNLNEIKFSINDFDATNFLFEIFSSSELFRVFIKYNLEPQNVSEVISYKGYINNLNTRSFITSIYQNAENINIYPHGGLNHAVWTEEQITSELSGAKWKQIQIHKNERKYYVNRKSAKQKNGILITLFSHTNFVSRFRAGMTHHEYLTEYLTDINFFLRNINTSDHKIRLRLPLDNRTTIDNISEYKNLGFEIDNIANFNDSIALSEIHIPTYNATLPFYSLINNIPSIFFWRDHHFPMPETFKNINYQLNDNKIIFNNPKDIAEHINNNSIQDIQANWIKNQNLINEYKSLIFNNC